MDNVPLFKMFCGSTQIVQAVQIFPRRPQDKTTQNSLCLKISLHEEELVYLNLSNCSKYSQETLEIYERKFLLNFIVI